MHVDVVTVFPEYFAPLELSLLGRARSSGLLTVAIHDLRAWTHDRHRTVDDTPYGGGAGMVMKPEPWGEALDALLGDHPSDDDAAGDPAENHPAEDHPAGDHLAGRHGADARLIVPTPSGERFSQSVAARLAAAERLVFACGRYEGIDQRVVDHYRTRVPVEEVSIGDFVLTGGEVAAMVMIESIVRLVPGFLGNPASLLEESHQPQGEGLLEYPTYTRPATWRSLDVPAVLLSGNHEAIEKWRRDQAMARTAERRPDLLHAGQTVALEGGGEPLVVATATLADAPELWVLQQAMTARDQRSTGSGAAAALDSRDLDEVRHDVSAGQTVVARAAGRLVGSIRARRQLDTWEMDRLVVVPDLVGHGLEGALLDYADRAAPADLSTSVVLVDARRPNLIRMLRRAGFRGIARERSQPDMVRLSKSRR